jgi:hypothetical protein
LGTLPKPALSLGFERRLLVRLQTERRKSAASRLKRFILWSYWLTAFTCSSLILRSMIETIDLSPQLVSALVFAALLLLLTTRILLRRFGIELTDLALQTVVTPKL